MKKIFLIIILGSLFLPSAVLAGEFQINGITINFEGLVPCGRCFYAPGIPIPEEDLEKHIRVCGAAAVDAGYRLISCQLCHLFVMLDTIIDFVFLYIIFPVATLMIVIGGGMFMFSGGSPQKIEQGRSILLSTIIGLVVIFSAWLLISLFLTTIGIADRAGPGEGWFMINCPIKLPR